MEFGTFSDEVAKESEALWDLKSQPLDGDIDDGQGGQGDVGEEEVILLDPPKGAAHPRTPSPVGKPPVSQPPNEPTESSSSSGGGNTVPSMRPIVPVASRALPVGSRVTLQGIRKPAGLNGLKGVVTGYVSTRVSVDVDDDGGSFNLKPSNLVLV